MDSSTGHKWQELAGLFLEDLPILWETDVVAAANTLGGYHNGDSTLIAGGYDGISMFVGIHSSHPSLSIIGCG